MNQIMRLEAAQLLNTDRPALTRRDRPKRIALQLRQLREDFHSTRRYHPISPAKHMLYFAY
jgi:hypothetical protein